MANYKGWSKLWNRWYKILETSLAYALQSMGLVPSAPAAWLPLRAYQDPTIQVVTFDAIRLPVFASSFHSGDTNEVHELRSLTMTMSLQPSDLLPEHSMVEEVVMQTMPAANDEHAIPEPPRLPGSPTFVIYSSQSPITPTVPDDQASPVDDPEA
jgi:hypothetical protein